jgi:hypothetical protein
MHSFMRTSSEAANAAKVISSRQVLTFAHLLKISARPGLEIHT